jgi:hypothetical protein
MSAPPDALTLANLSGAFQTIATLGFAMGVFRAPLSSLLAATEGRLQREEIIVAGRNDSLALTRQAELASLRRELNSARKRMARPIAWMEGVIWGASLASAVMLVWASLAPNFTPGTAWAVAMVVAPIIAVAAATLRIWRVAAYELRSLDAKLQ